MNISIDKLRKEFPITRKFVYLNHASTGPLPMVSARRMTEFLERLTNEVPRPQEIMSIIEETRQEIARLLGVKREEITITKNTTSGILIAIGTLDFEPGDNVVIQKGGFPTNQYPWHYLLPQVEKRYFDPSKSIPAQIDQLVDEKTRTVSVDLVDYLTGVKIDLSELRSCLRPGITLIVDGIQAVGATEFDLRPIDFMACGSGKWLLSPHGTGFLYIREPLLDSLKLTNIGWLSSEWKEFTRLEIKPLKESAARFEEGTYNYPGLHGMKESLRLLNSVGIKNISRTIKDLTDLIIDQVDKNRFEIITPANRAGIVTLRPEGDVKEIKRTLDEEGIIVSERMGCLRISPHFYNIRAEIEKLLEVLNHDRRITA